MQESDIHQGALRKTGLPLTNRDKSMLAKRSPIQVLNTHDADSLCPSPEPRTDRAATPVSVIALYNPREPIFY